MILKRAVSVERDTSLRFVSLFYLVNRQGNALFGIAMIALLLIDSERTQAMIIVTRFFWDLHMGICTMIFMVLEMAVCRIARYANHITDLPTGYKKTRHRMQISSLNEGIAIPDIF